MDTKTIEVLQSTRDWVKHWMADKDCGLAPTRESLTDALIELELEIARLRGDVRRAA